MCVMKGEASSLRARVLETICARGLVDPGDTVLAAVSGGADSVALLLLLRELSGDLGIRLLAAHYEHGIRGEESVADAAFVQGLCAARGIPLYMESGDVPALSRAWHCSLEDAARRARYAFFDETARQVGADKIALAHQLEDQAETLLLHLVHGSGLQGISGMRHMRGNRIRPLLDIPRAELEAYLAGQGVAWREDATNAQTQHARNLLRHEVFPLLRRLNPRVSEAMARTAALAAQAADSLRAHAEAALAGNTKTMPYGAYWRLRDKPVTAEAVRLFAEQAGVPGLDARQTEALCALKPGEATMLPAAWRAERTPERLHLLRNHWAPPNVLPEAFVQREAAPGVYGDGIRTQAIDADALAGAELRLRRPGDVFAPLGGQGTQKLKQTLRDAGIDRPFRDLLPVLAKGSRILWIVGVKPSRDAAITPDTGRAVQLEYRGDLPWEMATDNEAINMEEATDD